MPNTQSFFDYTIRTTSNYRKKIKNTTVKPKTINPTEVFWISDEAVHMDVLVALAKSNSPELIESKLEIK